MSQIPDGSALTVDEANRSNFKRAGYAKLLVAGGVVYAVDSQNNVIPLNAAVSNSITSGSPDITISGLTTDGSPDFNADYVRTYDASAGITKQVVLRDASGWISAGTTQLSSGVTVLLASSLPASIREILFVFNDVSFNNTGSAVIQLGINSGIVTAGYTALSTTGAGGDTTFTEGFGVGQITSADMMYGEVRVYRHSSNRWVSTHNMGRSTSSDTMHGAGKILLSAELTSLYAFCSGGTFDNGSISVFYRF